MIKNNSVFVSLDQMTLDGSNMKELYNYKTDDKSLTLVFCDGTTHTMPDKEATMIKQQFHECLVNGK